VTPHACGTSGSTFDALSIQFHYRTVKKQFSAIIEPAPEGGYWAICPEIAGANGQGETEVEAKHSLEQAIKLIEQISFKAG
jgi:predicted RNase H-like HicB family nuclease